ncbi:MAG: isoprenylcysteine carboxylmethyltransferase family protein [archaeon]
MGKFSAWSIISKFLAAIVSILAILFLPAGSLSYWNAWVYTGLVILPTLFVIAYFLKNDRKLLERRMRFKEKRASQGKFIFFSTILALIGFAIPGFDYRYKWSPVPAEIAIAASVGVFLGYLLVFFVMRENSNLSRVVEVEKGQKVVATGPYSIVRHPMYSGVIAMFLLTPLALGSFLALIPFLVIPPVIILRLLDEEKLLLKTLPGYRQYCRKTKYRLVPGIW